MQDGSVPVKTFLERMLPEAVAALTDPATADELDAREVLVYTLQVLHSAPLGGDVMDEDAFDGSRATGTRDALPKVVTP